MIRQPLSTPGLVAATALGALALTGLIAFFDYGGAQLRPAPAPERPAPVAQAPALTPKPAEPPPVYLVPIVNAPPIPLAPPFEVDDGLTIRTETQRVHLAGLEGPARDAICFDPDNKLWACGLQARAALYNVIRRAELVCRRVQPADATIPNVECAIGREDVGRQLVAQGFARPALERGAEIRAALDAAKRNNLGLWNGGWRIRP